MAGEGTPPGPGARGIVARLAEVDCPPEVRAGNLTGKLLAEFELMQQVLPPAVRWSVRGGLVAFDQGARLYPPSRGRRFVHLGDGAAEAYFRAVLARNRSGLGTDRFPGSPHARAGGCAWGQGAVVRAHQSSPAAPWPRRAVLAGGCPASRAGGSAVRTR